LRSASAAPCYAIAGLAALRKVNDRTDVSDALLAALARADSEAIRTVYRKHHGQVRAFARRLLGSEADAEEVVQDVFFSLPSAIRRFRGESTLSTFIMSVAVNYARHALRTSRRRSAAMQRLAEVLPSGVAPEPGSLPDDALAKEQLATRLLRAMEALGEDQRVAFVLSEVDERSSREVAEILGIPSSTVRSRVAAAREQLRSVLSVEVRP
jgi:RNA polymerase sigma-70 factor, ECF subfamily